MKLLAMSSSKYSPVKVLGMLNASRQIIESICIEMSNAYVITLRRMDFFSMKFHKKVIVQFAEFIILNFTYESNNNNW